ncbi:hypothetical protein [Paenibacillus graminis]|uniref:hypothetical protein n=1 Tax=Paenibacillus graminis TaxID=189425 RepID=UPI002DB8F0E4|nr:hypothetical protein [Paenibacillus graminis]MEC0171144.1 hypothetical protein [Paenibacillus graminis]
MSVDIAQVLEEYGVGPIMPDSHFAGRYYHLQVDYSEWQNYRATVMIAALEELEPAIGAPAVVELMEQVLWRTLKSREAVAAFLRAVFGEAGVNRQKE